MSPYSFTRSSSSMWILKAILAYWKYKMPYMFSLHAEINKIKKYEENLTQLFSKTVMVCVSHPYISFFKCLLIC
jgi:hypothetical protein